LFYDLKIYVIIDELSENIVPISLELFKFVLSLIFLLFKDYLSIFYE